MPRLNRCGVIGDVHCEAEVLEQVLEQLDAMGIDKVLCVGDLVDGPGDADAALALLRDRAVDCVAGNHERWFLTDEQRTLRHATRQLSDDSRAFIENLPKTRRYQTPLGGVMLCHGVGEADEAWLLPDSKGYALQDIPTLRELMLDEDIEFMIGGHTHERMVRVFPGLTVINAGTIHRKDPQTFTVVDFDSKVVEVYSAAPADNGTLIESTELPLPAPLS